MYRQVCTGNNPTGTASVTAVEKKPKTKYRPVALDTVELEKLGVRKLKITAKRVLAAAEKLYTQGFISYPR
jgi:DNA topoisomerase-3